MCKQLKFLVLIVLIISTMGNICEYPDPPTETPPDVCPSWDTDCDNISNAVETNDANSYLGLDSNISNANPSIAHGYPCVIMGGGWIENALNLVNEGTGYYHYLNDDPIDTDDWGVLHLINMIEGAGRDWYNGHYTPPRIGAGDLSWGDQYTQQFGGLFPPHSCHQNGTEADFRYVRNDEQEIGLDIGLADSIYYDLDATFDLMSYLIQNGNVIKIILSPYAGIGGAIVEEDSTGKHNNHFHVRIADPDGTGN